MFIIKRVALVIIVAMLGILPILAEQERAVVSPALNILSKQNTMALYGTENREISFEATDFERALNVSKLVSVTVTELPSRADGILYLGGSEVEVGQVIARANLSQLKFVFMSEDINNSSFCFSTDLGEHTISCNLYSLTYENQKPVISMGDAVMTVSTYCDVKVYGQMDAYDPEGDPMTYEIISYPDNGFVEVTDKKTGVFTYTPAEGYVGKDSFRYVAVDKYGNYSATAKIQLEVTKAEGIQTFYDLWESELQVAAMALAEQGIMPVSALGEELYFHPEETVTRAEFLVMAMKSLGIRPLAEGTTTVFADDGDMEYSHKGYINTAEKLGYISGRLDADGRLVFAPNDAITRAEAATMIYHMTTFDIPVFKPMFVDDQTIPAWAKDAVCALTSAGVMSSQNGYIAADAAVSKGECAAMLYALQSD